MTDRSRLVPLSCGRVFIQDLGPTGTAATLPPLLLLHGLLVTSYAFRDVVPPLSESRRVIAVDLPGCGESDRPDPESAGQYAIPWLADRVAELIGHLDLAGVDVAAHSFGGTVALCLAAENPALVRKMVLADPVAYPLELPLSGKMALMPRLGPYLFKTLYRRADLGRYLRGVMAPTHPLDETALNVYWDRLSRTGGREAAYSMLGHLTLLSWLAPKLAEIAAPTLLAWGASDPLVPRADLQRLVEALPDARLSVVAECGHAVPEERPGEFVALVESWCG